MANNDNTIHLRVIQLNDVYQLERLARLRTAVDYYSTDNLVVCLAGDFVGPSLLSSMDRGHGMVDTMEAAGVTHVSLGNHESDIPNEALAQRIQETKNSMAWVNSNMRSLDKYLNVETKEYDIIDLSTKNGHKRRVALLGLLSEVQSLYHEGAFAGASKDIEPVLDYTKRFLKNKVGKGMDLVLPMTHQDVPIDQNLAKACPSDKVPIILGGHDHFVHDEIVEGTRIMKTGMDAENMALIDITWQTAAQKTPDVSVELINLDRFSPSHPIQDRIRSHEKVLDELRNAKIFKISKVLNSPNDTFSTKETRYHPSKACTIFASVVRQSFPRADCAILGGGSIRGNKDYDPSSWFTFEDLKREFPFAGCLTVVEIPGSVLQDAIAFSRGNAPQEEARGFLHTCSAIEYDDRTKRIVSIQNEPFQPRRLYKLACDNVLLQGMDEIVPIMEWVDKVGLDTHDDAGKPMKVIFVEYFAFAIWLNFNETFQHLDTDADGRVSLKELGEHLSKKFGNLMVDELLKTADRNSDGFITSQEFNLVKQESHERIHSSLVEDLNGNKKQNLKNVSTMKKPVVKTTYFRKNVTQGRSMWV